ncbi:MAG: protein translocase subunit SecF [Chitinispirillia bacterium]|nr:protein translocase subunit SecF [Chitinispirillia bacterium]MCL2241786.1 protein translocase subunit SecF [Chitinispirillia bacterium]
MLQIFKNTKYNFLGYSKLAIGLSLAFIGASILMLIMNGGFNMSVDFAGGTTMQMKFEQPVRDQLPAIRAGINELGFGQPEIKTIGLADNNEIQITVRNQPEGVDMEGAIRTVLESSLAGNSFTVLRTESVGPKIGGELTRDAVIASIFALLAILLYVSIRFKPSFAVASVIPLFHDVLITLGIFAIFRLELTLPFVAAVLTIIGYSLNDTIVVFDRLRENVKNGLRGRTFREVANGSINQTLSRTIITTVTSLFSLVALYVLGSDAIKDFALALTIGVVVGTYSTPFIAVPILEWWNKKWPIIK